MAICSPRGVISANATGQDRERIRLHLVKSQLFENLDKVLDKPTNTSGRIQSLVRWRGYAKKYDSWVDETDTNEHFKWAYRLCHHGSPGLLQTLAVLIAQKLNVKTAPSSSIVRQTSFSMPMDGETFRELFCRLPSAPKPLQAYGNVRFSVPITKFDSIMPTGWSENTFRASIAQGVCAVKAAT